MVPLHHYCTVLGLRGEATERVLRAGAATFALHVGVDARRADRARSAGLLPASLPMPPPGGRAGEVGVPRFCR
jgi:hypothetical protein